MSLPLDHVVVAVADLERAAARCTEGGFTVVEGGRHPGRSSRNALIVFQDGSYIELITYDAPAPDERWWRVLSEHGDGLVDFALLPQDVDAVVGAARARGLTELESHDGGRARPDGVRIAWRSARPATADLPFLCADVTPRALRVPEGEVREHANGVRGIAEVQVAVRDVEKTLARYRAYLGPECVKGQQIELGACPSPLPSPQGGEGDRQVITVVQDPQRARGEGPCALRFRSAGGGALLDVPVLR